MIDARRSHSGRDAPDCKVSEKQIEVETEVRGGEPQNMDLKRSSGCVHIPVYVGWVPTY